MKINPGFWAGPVLLLTVLACEPATVTEAEDILGRNGGTVSFQFPVTDTTYLISDLLAGNVDTVTTSNGVLGVKVQNDTLKAFDFAGQLVTTELSTSVGFPTPVFAAPGDPRDTVRLTSSQGTSLVTGIVGSGYVVRSISNNTGCDGTVDGTVRDSLGATTAIFPTATVANGGVHVDSVSLAGAVLAGFAEVESSGTFLGACTPAPGTEISSLITVRSLMLTNATLSNVSETITVEQGIELSRNELNLDDLEDAVLDAAVNDATVDLAVVNSADIPVVVSGFFLTAVQLDGTGALMRDTGGNLIFETDGSGNRIEAAVADSGMTTLTIPRSGTAMVTVQAAPVIDRLIDLLVQNQRVALVTIGSATAGDAGLSSIADTDSVEVQFDVTLGLDFTLPAAGVTLEQNQASDGADLDSADIQDITSRLINASLEAQMDNSLPFGVEIELAFVPGMLDDTVDVFAQPGVTVLSPVTITAAPTGANGIPTASAVDSVSFGITGAQTEPVLGPNFTAGIRFRLLPRAGGGLRGAIVPWAGVSLDAFILVELQRGTGN